jgi:hypothetical protein
VEKWLISVDNLLLLWITRLTKLAVLARYGVHLKAIANIWQFGSVDNCLITVEKRLFLGITNRNST